MPDTEQIQFIRSIRNAPATILMLLMLHGGSLTNLEVQHATGYSDRTVTKSLALLDGFGLTQNNGRAAGWSLAAGQMSLPFPQMVTSGKSYPQAVDKEIVEFTISPSPSSSSSSNEEDGMKKEEKQRVDRKFYDLGANVDRKIYDLADDEDRNISDLLQAAGISPRSVKGREIIQAQLDPAYVAAHVAAWRDEGRPVGWLIKRLLDGDPPPAPRRRRNDDLLNQIPAGYEDIIKR